MDDLVKRMKDATLCCGPSDDEIIRELERLTAERDALQAKLDAAVLAEREDADRYRLLRRGQHWSVIDGVGDVLRAERLDAAIDAIRAEPK